MPAKYTARDWDEVRVAFASSIMINTALSSLAQNLEGPDWPIKGKEERPNLYLDLTYGEVLDLLELKGLPATRMDQLIGILKETLAFDDPFGDMVTQSQASADKDNPVFKNLAKLDIPENFPVALSALSAETKDFCRTEKLGTLGELAIFSQGLSQKVILGGDFRALLNALSHIDVKVIAQYLPFRPGTKGLHLIEAVALAVRALPAEQRAAVARKPAEAPASLRERITQAEAFFPTDKAALDQQLAGGTPLARLVQVVGDPAIEPAVAALLARKPAAGSPAAPGQKTGGWFSRLFKK